MVVVAVSVSIVVTEVVEVIWTGGATIVVVFVNVIPG